MSRFTPLHFSFSSTHLHSIVTTWNELIATDKTAINYAKNREKIESLCKVTQRIRVWTHTHTHTQSIGISWKRNKFISHLLWYFSLRLLCFNILFFVCLYLALKSLFLSSQAWCLLRPQIHNPKWLAMWKISKKRFIFLHTQKKCRVRLASQIKDRNILCCHIRKLVKYVCFGNEWAHDKCAFCYNDMRSHLKTKLRRDKHSDI